MLILLKREVNDSPVKTLNDSMESSQAINQTQIMGAALVMHVVILIIIVGGIAILKKGHKTGFFYPDGLSKHVITIVTFFIVILLIIVFSESFLPVWQDMFGTSFPGFPHSLALNIMFSCNIAMVTYIVWHTGGIRGSSFTPIFFFLPSLAIFLREPAEAIAQYALMILIVITVNTYWIKTRKIAEIDDSIVKLAYLWVAFLCFVLSIGIGLVTSS